MNWQQQDLESLYSKRFQRNGAYRTAVWHILLRTLIAPYLHPDMTVLDLGCGYGEFINQVKARRRFAMDLNPSAAALLDPEVTLFRQDCATCWPLPDQSLDVVFSSNFFEHLPDKTACLNTWREAWRCLRPGGRLVALGPNIAALPGRYWDFFDHVLPLSDRSLCEGLRLVGFIIERQVPRTLPYRMSGGRQYPLWMVRAYLRMPFLWLVLGRQFFVVARRADTPSDVSR